MENSYSLNKELVTKVIHHSLKLKSMDQVYIHVNIEESELIELLLSEIYNIGAIPFLEYISDKHLKALIVESTPKQLKLMLKNQLLRIGEMDAYISIQDYQNANEFNDIPKINQKNYIKYYFQPLQMAFSALKKWLILPYPSIEMAQVAKLGSFSFKNMYYHSCNFDYGRLRENAKSLSEILTNTKIVRILSPNTDLSFSIEGMPNNICCGEHNLPDGEVFTAPILNSVKGYIKFNVQANYFDAFFKNIYLKFENGRVVYATCDNKKELLQSIINFDQGSSRVGEFGIGINTFIERPYNDIRFDEKMCGSIHIALGQAYKKADNGNRSSIHWDLVLNQTFTSGGGELYFDNELIRKDGVFILPELKKLNKDFKRRSFNEDIRNRRIRT